MPRFRDLGQRRLVAERMDNPQLDRDEHIRALMGIRRLNFVSAAAASIWPIIKKQVHLSPMRVLDVACGSGDVTLALAKRARRSRHEITFEGCDVSPVALELARESARGENLDVNFFQFDALNDAFERDYSIIFTSLFLHHLTSAQAVALLRKMAGSAHVIVIDDLVRSKLSLALTYAACYTLSRSPVVHFDGPHSAAAAFTVSEMQELAVQAGLQNAEIRTIWPNRFVLVHVRSHL